MKRKFQEMQSSYLGTIKSFNPQKGWGFVECAETAAIYGKDILVPKDELGGTTVVPGQRVYFSVAQGRTGPIATDIQLLVPAGQMRAQQAAVFSAPMLPAPPSFNARAFAGASPGPGSSTGSRNPKPTKAVDAGENLCGVIKSYDEAKGFGFITGEALVNIYKKDVYLSKAAVRGQAVSPGDQVMFSVDMGQKGPMASNVSMLPGGTFGTEGATGNVFSGHIKSFNAEKGWGFVTSDETMNLFGKDLFLHKRELSSDAAPSPGDQVQFTVQLSAQGRPEAARVFPLVSGDWAYTQAQPMGAA